MPDPKAHEEAQQHAGLLPFAHSVPAEIATAKKRTPRDWAIAKELLKLNRDRSVHYTTHTPWKYQCAFVVHRWPDPEVDPTFVLTEEEFDEAIEAAVAGRSLKQHHEHQKSEEASLQKLAEQLDKNNAELAQAAAANELPAAEHVDAETDVESVDHTA